MEQFDLNRFIEAQEKYNCYEKALEEVRNGNKEGHWIWYIFPQMRGLGRSYKSNYYGITSLLEAKAYMGLVIRHLCCLFDFVRKT